MVAKNTFHDIVKPIDFLQEFSDNVIFSGELRAFKQER